MIFKKVLIYRNSSLGDFIHATPAIKLIKEQNPDAKIYFLSQKTNDAGFVTPNLIPLKKKIVDEYIFFQNNFLSMLFFTIKIYIKRFDKFYYLNEFKTKSREKRDYFFFKLLRINEMHGFNLKGASSDKKRRDYIKFNETYYLCRIVDSKINMDQISYSDLFNKIKKSKEKYITLSMGGKKNKKKWNIKYWELLIKKIMTNLPNIKIKILGSNNEQEMGDIISKIDKTKITNMCGKTTIKSLFNIINLSRYHLSHDDGTMHIASVYEKKGAAIFGASGKKGKWFPLNKKQKIFYPKKDINEFKPNYIFKKIIYDLKNLK